MALKSIATDLPIAINRSKGKKKEKEENEKEREKEDVLVTVRRNKIINVYKLDDEHNSNTE